MKHTETFFFSNVDLSGWGVASWEGAMAKSPVMGKHVEPHIPGMNYIEALAQI